MAIISHGADILSIGPGGKNDGEIWIKARIQKCMGNVIRRMTATLYRLQCATKNANLVVLVYHQIRFLIIVKTPYPAVVSYI